MSRYIDTDKLIFNLEKWSTPMVVDRNHDFIEILKGEQTADVIPIPQGATNGDMIKALFPNCGQKEHMHNGYFEMYFDDDLRNASYMRVSKAWWNAPYKREVDE